MGWIEKNILFQKVVNKSKTEKIRKNVDSGKYTDVLFITHLQVDKSQSGTRISEVAQIRK